MGGKKPLRRPLWPPTRATASNYYPLGLDGAGGAAKPLLRAPKKPAPLHGRLPAFSGAVDAFERARKCFLEWRYFFSIILSEFLKNRVALQQANEIGAELARLKDVRQEKFNSKAASMLEEVKKLKMLIFELEEPLETFDEKLFLEIVKSIQINKKDEMSVEFLGGLRFKERI